MDDKQLKKLFSLLEIIGKSLAINTIKDLTNNKDRMWLLHSIGITNQDIALILNTTPGTVKTTLSATRKSKKKEANSE